MLSLILIIGCSDDSSLNLPDDGNEYIIAGDQIWMKKNLNVAHYRNGDTIPHVTNPDIWDTLTSGAWCFYDNDPAKGELYGKLYNWYAVNDERGLAPSGWRVATDEDWKRLEMWVGLTAEEADARLYRGTNEGAKLAGNPDLWLEGALKNNVNFGSSGFDGLPGGIRTLRGRFDDIGSSGYWWTATLYAGSAWYRSFNYEGGGIKRDTWFIGDGFSVRCTRE